MSTTCTPPVTVARATCCPGPAASSGAGMLTSRGRCRQGNRRTGPTPLKRGRLTHHPQPAMEHAHPTREPTLARRLWQELNRRGLKCRKSLVHLEIREDHPRRTVPRLLPVEQQPHRHPRRDLDDIRAIATLDSDLHDLHPIGQLGLPRLLRPEEVPRQKPRQEHCASKYPNHVDTHELTPSTRDTTFKRSGWEPVSYTHLTLPT